MKVLKVELINFRNYRSESFNLEDKVLVVGENAAGKTNFLESISLLSLSKSIRSRNDLKLINWKRDYFRVAGQVEKGKRKLALEIFFQKKPKTKKFWVNQIESNSFKYIGRLKSTLFSPKDVGLIDSSPAIKRRYLDVLICQIDPEYCQRLSRFWKIVKNRNALLQSLNEPRKSNKGQVQPNELPNDSADSDDQLDYWDKSLSEHGLAIQKRRAEIVGTINEILPEIIGRILRSKKALRLKFLSQPDLSSRDDFQKEFTRTEYLELLLKNRKRDIEQGYTHLGPHRDNILFVLDDKEMSEACSRGEARLAVLALKLAEGRIIHKESGQRTVFLFDDIFSELDRGHRARIVDQFKDHQIIIATTDESFLDSKKKDDWQIIRITNGKKADNELQKNKQAAQKAGA